MANDSDIKSLMTLSSKSEGSIVHATRVNWHNQPLHERCTMQDMQKLKDIFYQCFDKKMFPGEFRNLLRELLNVEYDEDEFNILFLKVS